MKFWYARISSNGDYGRWIPTGCTELEQAREYIKLHYRPEGIVVEWLLL